MCEGESVRPIQGQMSEAARPRSSSESPAVKLIPVPTPLQIPKADTGTTGIFSLTGEAITGAPDTSEPPTTAQVSTSSTKAMQSDRKASRKPGSRTTSRPTTPPEPGSTNSTIVTALATPKLASPPAALRGGHTAQAPAHTGPSTGTVISVSGVPPATGSPAKHPAALTSGTVRRGHHEGNYSVDSVGLAHNSSVPIQGQVTPNEVSGRGTPGDMSLVNTYTLGTQTPEPGAYYTPPRSVASSINNFYEAPGSMTPLNASRPASSIGVSSPGSSPAVSDPIIGLYNPSRFAFPASGTPPSSFPHQSKGRNAGIARSLSLGHGNQRPRNSSGHGAMPTVQEGLNRARSQGHARRASQYDDPVNHGLMSLVGFDSAYPAPALNAQTSTKRLGSLHSGSVVRSHPSSSTGSSDKLDSPFMPGIPPGSRKVSSNGSVRDSYGQEDSSGAGCVSPTRSSISSNGPTHSHSFSSPSSGISTTKYTPITRDGTGKLGFRDIIDIATMNPSAFDRLDEVESDDDLHDPENLADLPRRGNSVRSWRASAKTGSEYREVLREKERYTEKDHVTGPPSDKKTETKRVGIRAFLNVGGMLVLFLAILMLFAGYPIYSHYRLYKYSKHGAYQIGGTNASGQLGLAPGQDGVTEYNLVFSDEFNTPGRSFYPGDDPFWEAVNLHYWQTNNYEWYDPAGVTTRDGTLSITLSQHPDHNLNFRGGMVQSWNKFCFTGGLVIVSVRLPGEAHVGGLWPAIWMMGNLGRAGYGASLEGTWPYTYDSCDTGTMANQTDPVTRLPNTTTLGDCPFNIQFNSKALSYLPGQKLSACTCAGEDHPGPKLKDGTLKGRGAPELDIFEAQVSSTLGMTVSQSLQLAPFNAYYKLSEPPELFNNQSRINSYTGELTQQAASGITPTDQRAIQYPRNGSTGIFSEYSVEYEPGNDGFIKWESDGKPAWMINSSQLQPDPLSGISRRPVPEEPLYLIMNLGISSNFGSVSWDELKWPNQMDIDWVRVYQHGTPRIGCDPEDFPTKGYIERHIEAYTNPNLTLWGNTRDEGGYEHPWPRNRLYPGGCSAPSSTLPGSSLHKMPSARIYKPWEVGQGNLCEVPNSSG